jgi:hypothetical protein
MVILVPYESVGLLLGKAGMFFKFIGHTSGATLTMQSFSDMLPQSRERTLSISGTLQSILSALRIVMNRLQKMGAFARAAAEEEQDCGMIHWIIPQSHAGLLIGKQGHRIRWIHEVSGAWVKMANPEEPTPGEGLRSVYIRGTAEQRQRAIAEIYQLVGGYHLDVERRPGRTGPLDLDDPLLKRVNAMDNCQEEMLLRGQVNMRLKVLSNTPIVDACECEKIDDPNYAMTMYAFRGSLDCILETVSRMQSNIMRCDPCPRQEMAWVPQSGGHRATFLPHSGPVLQDMARATAGCGPLREPVLQDMARATAGCPVLPMPPAFMYGMNFS